MKRALAVVLVLAIGGVAQAGVIAVPNGSFEDPDVVGNNKAAIGTANIPYWTHSGNGVVTGAQAAHMGVWDTALPGATGGQMAMVYISGGDNGRWFKLTSGVLASSIAGQTYTLSADFADAGGAWQPALAELQLWVGGAKVATVAGDVSQDQFVGASLDYEATASGQDIFVQVLFTGAGGTGYPNKAAVDNVQLSVTPEPATMSLLALGALGLLRKRR